MKTENRHNSFCKKYVGKYTLLFLILCAGVFFPFIAADKSLIWRTDGAAQYFPYLHYMGNYLRDTLEGFLLHGQRILGMFDFSIGMGDDLGAIFRSHPLDFLAVVVPGKYTEVLYEFLVLFRIYLAGLSFSGFCFYWKKKEPSVLLGSMVYIFSGYVLTLGMRHPTFSAPMIILPLLLVGADQVIRGKNGLLFSFMTALGFISNYYFMYMCSIAMACYVVLRFFGVYKEKKIRNFFCMGIRLVLYYLLGIGGVAVVLFPTVLRLTTSARLATTYNGGWLAYKNVERYYKWFVDLIAPYKSVGNSTYLSYAVLVLPVLALLFSGKWREHLSLKIALLLETIGILVPLCGYIMSGFSNVNNRWIFIFSLTLSFACVVMTEKFHALSRKQVWTISGISLLYFVLVAVHRKEGGRYWIVGAAQLAVCVCLILILRRKKVSEKMWNRVLLGIVCCSCVVNGYYTYSMQHGNIVSEYMENGETWPYFTEARFKRFNKIEDDGFYRVDTNTMGSGKENMSVILGYNGISMYNSIINANIIEYLLDQESPGINAVHRLYSMDGRAASEALANVKYYLAPVETTGDVPYGFTLNQEFSGDNYLIFENQYPLSFGYCYDQYISQEDYDQLSALEKQQIMLEAVVLSENADTSALTGICEGKDEILTVPLELPAEGENISVTQNGYKPGEGGGSFFFSYEKKPGYEAYLRFKGLYMDVDAANVDITTSDVSKRITLRGKNHTYTLGRKDYLVNLGYCGESGKEEIEVYFNASKKFQLEGLEICYVSMDNYVSDIEKLNRESLQNTQVGINTISGNVKLSEDRFMVFSVPYSGGWTAWVDGEKAELTRANVMYMGIALDAGEHEIRLEYCTPGVKVGAVITVISYVIFLVLLLRWMRKRKQNRVKTVQE